MIHARATLHVVPAARGRGSFLGAAGVEPSPGTFFPAHHDRAPPDAEELVGAGRVAPLMRVRFRLSLKLAVLVVAAVVVTAASGCLAAIVIGRAALKASALEEAEDRVEIYARAIGLYVDHAVAVLETTASFPVIRRFALDRSLASLVLARSSVFESIMLLRPDGAVHLLEPRDLERRFGRGEVTSEAWFRAVAERRITIVSDLQRRQRDLGRHVVADRPAVPRSSGWGARCSR